MATQKPKDRKRNEPARRGTMTRWLGFLLVLALLVASAALAVVGWRQAGAMRRYVPQGSVLAGSQAPIWQRLWRGAPTLRPELGADPSSIGAAFEVERINVGEALDLGAWRIRQAGAPGVVLLFGDQGDSRSDLLPDAAGLLAAGWEVLLVDMRGTGDSDGGLLSLGWHEAADVIAVFERERLRRDSAIVLFGRGAAAAAILRALHLSEMRPTGLILDQPFASLRDRMGQHSAARRLPPIPLAMVSAFCFGLLADLPAFAFAPARWAGEVQLPALVLGGGPDTVASAREVYQALRGPRRWHGPPRPATAAGPAARSKAVAAFLELALHAPGSAPPDAVDEGRAVGQP